MKFIDPRTYYQYDFWKNQGKSYKWLKGYDAGFNDLELPKTASSEYSEGHTLGKKDREKEKIPPLIKQGLLSKDYPESED